MAVFLLLGVLVVEEWSHRYGDRMDGWRLPTSRTRQNDLALAYACPA